MTLSHKTHYRGIEQRGPGMMIIEATGVVHKGRRIPSPTLINWLLSLDLLKISFVDSILDCRILIHNGGVEEFDV